MADRDLELLREEIRAHREESRAEIRAMRKESREFIRWMTMSFEQHTAAMRDMRDDIRANTRALLHVLDRLDETPGAQA